ncbi:protein SULFUR DEFICIENCY-INDUCED 1 [Cucumis melo var. makuwa]|uniref:Protein SULFUR DEFICIENCY-INDUCED 1 n=1 Tax=Cucumis melo var. makuwa TaxID=1194695 RepID=A0A5D3D295_CUCMM|nr:protein SULFUR DEFICIENCY-INDUCED 1 [Cucumis melo var. makuwa]
MNDGKKGDQNLETPFHVVHKLPAGDSPYVRAKHVQLVQKDPEAAIVLFWKAINAGDRVDSALKDMAVVMKQQDRAEEAIEAINSFRDRCSKQAQESLDNVLIDLYKKCGRVEEQIDLLKQKLRMINQGEAFNGKATKTARSHGKKFQVTIRQETSRILSLRYQKGTLPYEGMVPSMKGIEKEVKPKAPLQGNLGWAYMQQENHKAAEAVYQKAQIIDPDANKACNLSLCLMKQSRHSEARAVLEQVLHNKVGGSNDQKSRKRAEVLMKELEEAELANKLLMMGLSSGGSEDYDGDGFINQSVMNQRLPIFEEISQFRDQLAC